MKVELVNADVLRVAPDEVLIITGNFVEEMTFGGDDPQDFRDALVDALEHLGLRGRALLIDTGSVRCEMAIVKKDAA